MPHQMKDIQMSTQLMQPFDATVIAPNQSGGGGLPVGKHPVVITEAEVKATKDNTGGLIEIEVMVINGPAKDSTGVFRINLYNASEKARAAAQGQMSALCHVTGVFKPNDVREFYNKPFMVEVGLQKGEEAQIKGYTEVKKILDMNGNEPGKTSSAAPQPQQDNNAGVGNASFANNNQGTNNANTNTNNGSGAQWGNGNNGGGQNNNAAPQTNNNANWGGGNGGGNAGGGNAPWGQQ